jgi:hypothetical protein
VQNSNDFASYIANFYQEYSVTDRNDAYIVLFLYYLYLRDFTVAQVSELSGLGDEFSKNFSNQIYVESVRLYTENNRLNNYDNYTREALLTARNPREANKNRIDITTGTSTESRGDKRPLKQLSRMELMIAKRIQKELLASGEALKKYISENMLIDGKSNLDNIRFFGNNTVINFNDGSSIEVPEKFKSEYTIGNKYDIVVPESVDEELSFMIKDIKTKINLANVAYGPARTTKAISVRKDLIKSARKFESEGTSMSLKMAKAYKLVASYIFELGSVPTNGDLHILSVIDEVKNILGFIDKEKVNEYTETSGSKVVEKDIKMSKTSRYKPYDKRVKIGKKESVTEYLERVSQIKDLKVDPRGFEQEIRDDATLLKKRKRVDVYENLRSGIYPDPVDVSDGDILSGDTNDSVMEESSSVSEPVEPVEEDEELTSELNRLTLKKRRTVKPPQLFIKRKR